MCDLTSALAQTTLESTEKDYEITRRYNQHLSEVPPNFTPLSPSDLSHPRILDILTRYASWFDAKDDELEDAKLPKAAFEVAILSRAMVQVITKRACSGDSRKPPISPTDHACSPFWSPAELCKCPPCTKFRAGFEGTPY